MVMQGGSLTGGGRLINRITKPAIIKNTSRNSTMAVNQTGKRLQYASDITRDPTSTLSAIGSRNDPNLLDCDGQFLAM